MKDTIAAWHLALLNIFLLTLGPATFAAEPGSIVSAPSAHAAGPAGLLPCPLSVPCIARPQDDGENGAVVGQPAVEGDRATAPEPAGSPTQPKSEALLPCPLSVPCIATAPVLPALPDSIVSTDTLPTDAAPEKHTGAVHQAIVGVTKARRGTRIKPTRSASTAAPIAPPVPPVRPAAAQPPVGEVGMAGGNSYAASAQERLAEASRGLTAVNPETLSAQARPTYQEASNFVMQSRAALQVHDNLAALTLAQKACQLLNDLQPGNGAPHPR
jgi:hypothetical protein